MAFVNRQGGEQRRNEMADSGQLIDFDPNDPTVVKVHYDLALWTWEQRAELSEALADDELPHVWDGEELVVPELVEDAVDDLLDAIEAGELLSAEESPAAEPPDGALGSIFLAADRLARDPLHAGSRATLLDLDQQIDPRHPPYAFAPRTWSLAVERVRALAEQIRSDAAGRGSDDEQVLAEGAEQLRELLRPFV